MSLKFSQPVAAQAYADAVSQPDSPLFRQFLTPEQIAQRFGPAQADYQAVVAHLQANGLQILSLAPNRLSIQAQGTTTQIETAFGTRINLYQESQADRLRRAGPQGLPLTFYANATPVQLPASIAGLVEGVAGLESYARAVPKFKRGASRKDTAPYVPSDIRTAYDTVPLYNSSSQTPAGLGMQGQNRTIGIVELGNINANDILNFLTAYELPLPNNRAGGNITYVNVNGGSDPSTGTEPEANLDVQMVLGMAPLANIVIYNSNGEGVDDDTYFENFLAVVTQIVSDNNVDIVTDSWGITPADADGFQQFHDQHLLMTMQGITYLNASGDAGSNLDAGLLYSETDPDVLAVGGTVLTLDANNNIVQETGWIGSGGGYSAEAPFALPAYQVGRSIPTDINYRLVPDIALHAAGPQSVGACLFFVDGQLQTNYVGTSFSAPICAGCLALVEQYLISQNALPADASGHQRLGRLNDALYAMNGRSDVFHDITVGRNFNSFVFPNGLACGPHWDFVTGWGSLDFYNLAVALQSPLAVTTSPNSALVIAGTTLPLTATVQGSNVQSVTWSVVDGPGSVDANGVYTAPDSDAVTDPEPVTVRATSTIDTALPVFAETTLFLLPTSIQSLTLSANSVSTGATVQGTVTLNGPAGPEGIVVALSAGNNPAIALPDSVTVLPGATSQTFTISILPVLNFAQVLVTASYDGIAEAVPLTLNPNTLPAVPSSNAGSANPPPHTPPGHS